MWSVGRPNEVEALMEAHARAEQAEVALADARRVLAEIVAEAEPYIGERDGWIATPIAKARAVLAADPPQAEEDLGAMAKLLHGAFACGELDGTAAERAAVERWRKGGADGSR